LDIQKAFDTVNYNILIKKLYFSGIRGSLLKWLISYLTERLQSVKLKSSVSEYLEIKSRVPQGSTLGSLLFSVYVNDLANLGLFGNLYSFADDTALIYNAVNEKILINNITHDLNILTNWFSTNKICPNINKSCLHCFYLHESFDLSGKLILHKNINCANLCNCSPLNVVSETKYLGIILDSGLTWGPHLKNLSLKLSKLCRIFYRLQFAFSPQHRKKIYLTLFEPLLMYGLKIWGGAAKSHLKLIETQQKRVLRYIFQSTTIVNARDKFLSLKLLPISSLYIFVCAMYIAKNVDKFPIQKIKNQFRTRTANKTNFLNKNWLKEKSRNQFSFAGPTEINSLPENIKLNILHCKALTLKKKLKDYLINSL